VDLKDKIVESRDAVHVELQQREEQGEHGKDRLPPRVVEVLHEASRERRAQLLGAIRMILGRQRLEVGQLRMPPRETHALHALQAAVEGKSTDLQQFVYASDRRDLLERALGVLQPDLTRTDDKTARELHAQLADLCERLGELRDRLSSLEDAQDELLHPEAAPEVVTAPNDPPRPKPSSRPSDPDAPRPASTLAGPELAEPPAAETTLTGPERPELADRPPAETTLTGPELAEPPAAETTLTGPELAEPPTAETTLTGPELAEPPAAETTLTGPELAEPPAAETTLTGPELPEAPPAPSTLGGSDDALAGDPAAPDGGKSKQPWWRRPFG
jgi:hypothetical protein